MPDFEFNCRFCQHPLICDEAERGSSITCPQCQKPLRIPSPGRGAPIEMQDEYPKATLAMVCGILSLTCFGLLTGIFAILFGHMGISGYGKCLAALIMGYLSIFTSFILLGVLAAMLLPALGSVREKANVTKCKNQLKQMGLCMNSYFSDGVSTHMPKGEEASGPVDDIDADYWGFQGMIQCGAAHQGGGSHYIWNPSAAGAEWSLLNNPSYPMIWESSPNKVSSKVNVLFGDGHVEERDPSTLR
jgi:prepilin-type processing-associated H-X9-DG protein